MIQLQALATNEQALSQRELEQYVQAEKRQIVRVLTKSGYTIDVSTNHPLLVASEEELPHFRKAGEIAPGIFACIDRSEVKGQIVDLPEIRYQKTNNPQKRVTLPTTLTEDLAWALGVIVGDGSYRDQRDGTIEITNQDLELINKYNSIFEGFGLNVSIRAVRNHYRIYFISKPLRYWLEDLGLDYLIAFNKKTPHVIFSATAQVRAAYLRGLFDTDGSVGKINARFTSSSRQLVNDDRKNCINSGISRVPAF